eukprot:TRINITY_DN16009_c0_g1_i1.p1 TRINITY_DN16009_c0_g1~~TRINITY_DN16009_c0_g1_i1.p1  ORF type:complete len:268 (-),score=43.87 TRINITY_DN16009_c0_g1_i1:136-939(-)
MSVAAPDRSPSPKRQRVDPDDRPIAPTSTTPAAGGTDAPADVGRASWHYSQSPSGGEGWVPFPPAASQAIEDHLQRLLRSPFCAVSMGTNMTFPKDLPEPDVTEDPYFVGREKVLKTFQPAKRLTPVDLVEYGQPQDRRGLNRALDQRLYMITTDTPQSEEWDFPTTDLHEGENLLEAAERQLKHDSNELQVYWPSNAPIAHLRVDGKDAHTVYFMHAIYVAGRPMTPGKVAWITRQEVADFRWKLPELASLSTQMLWDGWDAVPRS